MRFTDIFIKRPVLATSLSLLILLVGVASFFSLQIRQYPKLTNTVVTVTTTYPGASADLVQGFVTQPLQSAIASAEGIDYMTSDSGPGVSTITVTMQLNFDPNAALTNILTQIQSVRSQLPSDIDDPTVAKSVGETTQILYLSMSSDRLTAPQLTDYIQRVVKPKLATVSGVAGALIYGQQDIAIRIWLDAERLASYGLTAADIRQAVEANNYQSLPGQIRGAYTVFNVEAKTGLERPEEFERMVVATRQNAVVRLGDVADVTRDAKSKDVIVRSSGREVVIIAIDPTPQANPLTVVAGIRQILPDMVRDLPEGIALNIIYDSTTFIQRSIEEVRNTLIEATLIVIVVIFLFLASLRATLIPVVTIPLSLVGVCMMLALLGFSINLLTLLAMVLAIGLVVDDAIVVVENVDRHLKQGKSSFQAAIYGTREIAVPVISMTITLAAVYAPIAFTGGLTGSLFQEFALTLAGAVFVSGVVALTLSPMMCSLILKPDTQPNRFQRAVEHALERTNRLYRRALGGILHLRLVVAAFAVAVVVALFFLYRMIPAELAPTEDQGVLLVVASAQPNAHVDYTAFFMKQAEDIMAKVPESETAFTFSGYPTMNQGIGIVTFKPWGDRQRTQTEIKNAIQPQMFGILGVNAPVIELPSLPGPGAGGLPVQFVVNTINDYRSLALVMERFRGEAYASGLFAYVDIDLKFENPTIVVRVNRDKAGAYGVTMASIGATLATMMGGGRINRTSIDGRSYEVIPQVPRAARLTPDAIRRFYVKAGDGSAVPLSDLITVETDIRPVSLTQFNQLNAATFGALLMPGVSMGQAIEWLQQAALRSLPQGYSVDYKGESRQYVKEGSSLVVTMGLALLVIFLVLACQFESFRDPFVILISVPLAAIGALGVMALGFSTWNIYSQIGLITLVGLITKHGILICEVAMEQQEKHGLNKVEAVTAAAAQRLRPILMTTGAMVAGLVPLVIASGPGAASRQSIGVVIVAGLAVGTLFTLFVLPVIYTFLASDHAAKERERQARAAQIAAEA
ncbi:MAG: efflux RND transporter permease subunit [Reyranellaceae bacterium]